MSLATLSCPDKHVVSAVWWRGHWVADRQCCLISDSACVMWGVGLMYLYHGYRGTYSCTLCPISWPSIQNHFIQYNGNVIWSTLNRSSMYWLSANKSINGLYRYILDWGRKSEGKLCGKVGMFILSTDTHTVMYKTLSLLHNMLNPSVPGERIDKWHLDFVTLLTIRWVTMPF